MNDVILGCLFGGAVGDALGYPIEFLSEEDIFHRYGENGITEYCLDGASGKALISDDTQMTLFTATGILLGETRAHTRGIGADPHTYVRFAYRDWLKTQELSYSEARKKEEYQYSWLCDVPELYARRAPGNTCLSALESQEEGDINHPLNHSKGCGGIMRVAPLALYYEIKMEKLDKEGAEIAALTHGHSLGYMPAAVLTHVINRITFPQEKMSLKEIIMEARDTVYKLFQNDEHIDELVNVINQAIELSENDEDDLANVHQIGEGWVAEETLGISLYCALRYQSDFSAGVIAAVNHNGDSDSTGAVTGNILGALVGYDAIDDKWKCKLELSDVIMEVAEDISNRCQLSEYSGVRDVDWERKYIEMHRD